LYYVVNSKYINGKSVYDILYEAKSLRDAYDFLYNNNYKPFQDKAFKAPHFSNGVYINASVWKEQDLEQILIDYVNYIINKKEDYLGYRINHQEN
jgi:hypothetical protein